MILWAKQCLSKPSIPRCSEHILQYCGVVDTYCQSALEVFIT